MSGPSALNLDFRFPREGVVPTLMAPFRGKAGFPRMSKPCLHEERSAFSVFDSHIASCYA